jgi:N-formylglutamate amidohydrolase
MGDGAEGLIDAQARIQDRLDELEQLRARPFRIVRDLEREQRLQSLRLARAELARQSAANGHPVRRQQLTLALAEIDRRIAELRKK